MLPSALAALGVVDDDEDVLGIGECRAVIVLVADGLGWRHLRGAEEDAPFLASRAGRAIDAAVPTTTVTGLATVGTGTPPGQHGLMGYTVAHPDHDQPFNLLTWRVGMRGGGSDARATIVPESLQPATTALERAQAAGVLTTALMEPGFLDSGLTRAVLRGGQRLGVNGLTETIEGAVTVASGPGRRLVYAHHGAVDTMGHVHGPLSAAWRGALRDLDAGLAAAVLNLPEDVVVVVTADHGMVEVVEADIIELAEHDDLMDGVRVLAGEPRFRQLACLPGATDRVAERWRELLGDRADVLLKDEAVAAGWFGPEVSDVARERLGDVLVAMSSGTVVHRRVDPHGGRQRGQHGSLTPDEVEVPLLVLRRD